MAVQTFGTITQEQRTFYVGTLLKRLIPFLPFLMDAQKTSIPRGQGVTAQWRKYNALSLATTALTEGVTPAGNSLSVSTVTATIGQYGDFVKVSDLLVAQAIDDTVVNTTEVLGEQAGQTLHRLMITELGASSSVRYSGTATSRVTVSAVLTVATIRLAVRDLERANVPKFADGFYHGGLDGSQKYDVISDPAWQDIYRYTNTAPMTRNEIGEVYGARWWLTSDVPVFTGAGAGAVDVHAAVLYGPQAYGAIDLAAMGMGTINETTNQGVDVFVIPVDSPSKADPLKQFGLIGWKVAFAAKIVDSARIERIETAVTA